MPTEEYKRRQNRKANEKKRKRHAAKKERRLAGVQDGDWLTPIIKEADLLAFQLAHFGDSTEPATWFVEAQTALEYDPAEADTDADGLGCYDDGAKRTLTDEQIAIFRHSEIEELKREGKWPEGDGEELGDKLSDSPLAMAAHLGETNCATPARGNGPGKGVKDVTDHVGQTLEADAKRVGDDSTTTAEKGQPTPSSRSDTSASTGPVRKKREQEIPYDQRNKRKWERYIADEDPLKGSLTHRRIVREQDSLQNESVDLEY